VPSGAALVLVDDVVTSGATLTVAAATLSRLLPPGAVPVLAAVVAATPRGRS
jgi:predicted amidophosphoribosyltransferase